MKFVERSWFAKDFDDKVVKNELNESHIVDGSVTTLSPFMIKLMLLFLLVLSDFIEMEDE